MAITITHQGSANSKATQSSLTTGTNIATSTGDLIVVAAACLANATAPTCTDTKGNTYTRAKTLPFNTSADSVCVFYCANATALAFGTDTITVNFGVSSGAQVIDLWSVLGIGATATLDVSPSTTGSTATPSLASGTLANANEAVFAVLGINRALGGTFTIDTANGWAAGGSNVGTTGGGASSNINLCTEWQVVAATTSRTAAPTITAVQWGDIIVSFSAPATSPPPTGWDRIDDSYTVTAAAKAKRAALLVAASAGLFWCPQPITQAVASTPTGWQAQSPQVTRHAQAVPTQATTFAVPAPASNNTTAKAWQQPLSVPLPVAKAQQGYASVPFNTPQIAASVPQGWWSIPSVAPPRAVINGSALTFVVPPFDVPRGWQSQSAAAPSVAKAQQGSTFVPSNTVQVAAATPQGWQSQSPLPAPVAKAQLGSSFVPFNTAQTNTATIDKWQQPLSIAVSVAKAQQGYVSTPFITAQIVPIPLTYDAGVNRSVPVYYQALISPLRPIVPASNSVTGIGWQQSLSKPVNVVSATPTQATTFSVPAQASNSVTQYGWYQPLSKSVPIAQAQQGNAFVPLNTAQIVAQTPQGWQAPLSLSIAPLVAKAQQGAAFVPFDTPQATPAGIAGMAWFTPLSVLAPVAVRVQSGATFVPLNTVQITPSGPTEIHNHPFFATVGQLMGGM